MEFIKNNLFLNDERSMNKMWNPRITQLVAITAWVEIYSKRYIL